MTNDSPGGRRLRLGHYTMPELNERADKGWTVLIPLGTIEQHGKHMPTDTDTALAEHFSFECAKHFDDVIVAPAVPWGLSANHAPFGATITLRVEVYLQLLLDIAKGLMDSGFHNQVWINGHNSNRPTLTVLVNECQQRWNLFVGAANYFDFGGATYRQVRKSEPGGEYHGGEQETSVMLSVDSSRVGEAERQGAGTLCTSLTSFDFGSISGPPIANVGFSFKDRFPDGIAGNPGVASLETGNAIAEADLEGLVQFVDEYRAYKRTVGEAGRSPEAAARGRVS
jgi:creatinine amidohydrolase